MRITLEEFEEYYKQQPIDEDALEREYEFHLSNIQHHHEDIEEDLFDNMIDK